MATNASTRFLTVEEFLRIDFGPDAKAELDNGIIRMMAGGKGAHNRLQRNVLVALANKLSGTGCTAWGPDTGVRAHDFSMRLPDVSVYCGRDGPENDEETTFDNPKLIVEILSDSTRTYDMTVKLAEYRAIKSLDTILFIDPMDERIRLLSRENGEWDDTWLAKESDVLLSALGIALARSEIFARG